MCDGLITTGALNESTAEQRDSDMILTVKPAGGEPMPRESAYTAMDVQCVLRAVRARARARVAASFAGGGRRGRRRMPPIRAPAASLTSRIAVNRGFAFIIAVRHKRD